MGAKKRILIVDDHPLFREGLKSLIARSSGFEVAGEAGSASEGLHLLQELKPDIVLMDVSLPDMSGIDAIRHISGLGSCVQVVVVSMHSKIDHITEAFQAGAKGYVTKESAADRLVQCLDAVAKGDYFLDSSLSFKVVKRLAEFPEKESRITDDSYAALTPREQQVMRLLAEGLSTKAIAENLCISPKTVDNHRTRIMEKLNVHSSMELVRYAAKLGLIDVDLWKD